MVDRSLHKQEDMCGAIEQNFSEFFFEMAHLKGCKYEKDNNFNWVKSSNDNWPSGIFDIKFEVGNVNAAVEDMVSKMASGQLPTTLMTGPSVKLKNYDKIFNQYGLTKKYEATGMAMDLKKNELSLEDIKDLTISQVKEKEVLIKWSEIVCVELFGKSGDFIVDFYNTILNTMNKARFKCFVGKYKGKVVATSFLYMNNGIAGIYFVATHKDYRNKGIGKLITLAPLIFAIEHDYSIAILQASPLGEIIYKKLGFKEYCRLGRYKLN